MSIDSNNSALIRASVRNPTKTASEQMFLFAKSLFCEKMNRNHVLSMPNSIANQPVLTLKTAFKLRTQLFSIISAQYHIKSYQSENKNFTEFIIALIVSELSQTNHCLILHQSGISRTLLRINQP